MFFHNSWLPEHQGKGYKNHSIQCLDKFNPVHKLEIRGGGYNCTSN